MLLITFLVLWTASGMFVHGEQEFDAVNFLGKFGYLQPTNNHNNAHDSVNKAIRDYQEFFILPDTGHLDKRTVEMMKQPRCGNVDIVRKRENLEIITDKDAPLNFQHIEYARRWKKHDLTYIAENTPTQGNLQNRRKLEREIRKAFKVWSDITPLKFRKINQRSNEKPDFVLTFARGAHKICTNNSFDGPHGILAHAFPRDMEDYPFNGLVHFDDDEAWFKDEREAHDAKKAQPNYPAVWFFVTAAHEIGHSLGLAHSLDPTALMYPVYGNAKLSEDDIRGIQDLYGPNYRGGPHPTGYWEEPKTAPPATPMPTQRAHAPHCYLTFDAVIQAHNDKFYAFSGSDTYEIHENNGDPIKLRILYKGAPSKVDAVVYNHVIQKTYMFSGSQYYRFTGFNKDSGYPKSLSHDFSNLNAACFQRNRLIVYKDNRLSPWTPGRSERWRSRMTIEANTKLFVDMDALVRRREDGMVFAFKGTTMIKFNEANPSADGSSDKIIDMRPAWLNCNKPISS